MNGHRLARGKGVTNAKKKRQRGRLFNKNRANERAGGKFRWGASTIKEGKDIAREKERRSSPCRDVPCKYRIRVLLSLLPASNIHSLTLFQNVFQFK